MRATIQDNQTINVFKNRAAAQALAAQSAADDSDGVYNVIERKDGRYVVEVRDETNEFLGCL